MKSSGETLLLALMPPQPVANTANIAKLAIGTNFRFVITEGGV